MTTSTTVFDVTDDEFQVRVIDRSRDVPVVVDFWAAWCGPCRTLGPMLESAVAARGGTVELAKIDVDSNPRTAQQFGIQGIPQVYGFRDGQAVAQFTGVVPQPQLESFLDDLMPSAADIAVQQARTLDGEAREAVLRRALEHDPHHRDAAITLATELVDRDPTAARELAAPFRPDPEAEALLARIDLGSTDGVDIDALRRRVTDGEIDASVALGRALAASGDYNEAIDVLLSAVATGGDVREPAREQLVALFLVLGDDDPRVQQARPRLARALF